MLIASHIKPRRKPTRTVHVHGTPYVFEQKTNNGEFVAEVSNPAHAEILLGSRHFSAVATGRTTLTRTPPPADPPKEDEKPSTGDAPPAFTDAQVAEATTLLTGSASAIGKDVGQVSSLDVVRCAIDIEGKEKARKSVLALLQSTLEAAAQAGVS